MTPYVLDLATLAKDLVLYSLSGVAFGIASAGIWKILAAIFH